MIIRGEKGRLILTLSMINAEMYPAILKSLLRVIQATGDQVDYDDRLNVLLLLEDMMPEEKQIEKMIKSVCPG